MITSSVLWKSAPQKPESPAALSPNTDSTSSPSESPASCSKSSKDNSSNGRQKSTSRRGGESTTADSLPEITQAGDLFSVTVGSLDVPPVRNYSTHFQFAHLLHVIHRVKEYAHNFIKYKQKLLEICVC